MRRRGIFLDDVQIVLKLRFLETIYYSHVLPANIGPSSFVPPDFCWQELSENMGLKNLRERFNDPYMAEVFQGMFPTDNPRNTRFAINFFTAIGLGGLTDGLRLHLKNAPKMIMQAQVGPVVCVNIFC